MTVAYLACAGSCNAISRINQPQRIKGQNSNNLRARGRPCLCFWAEPTPMVLRSWATYPFNRYSL